MPIHDWTRVSAGLFHAFHLRWLSEIQLALNDGLLPESYYALAEQVAGPFGPDVLTLQAGANGPSPEPPEANPGGSVAVAARPPRMRISDALEADAYAAKRRTIVVRHSTGDRVVALLEIVSPGNKSSKHGIRSFVHKAVESLVRGYHLLVVDLFPPTPRDPRGLHDAIWTRLGGPRFTPPEGEPLTLAAYTGGASKRAWVEPTATGRELVPAPLFLDADHYVDVPLEETYQAAYRGMPKRWKDVLDAPAS